MLEAECYQILRISENSNFAEIKRAYRRSVQLYHPDARTWDRNSGERFKKIASAYKMLSDKKRHKKDMNRPRRKMVFPRGFRFYRKEIISPLEPSKPAASVAKDVEHISTFELARRFLGTENVFVRREVVKAFGHKKDKEAMRVLTRAIKAADSETRRLALQSLAVYREPRVVYLIASLLEDPDVRVRYAAIAALGMQGGGRATLILKRLTGSKSIFIREKAQEALYDYPTKIFRNTLRPNKL